MAIRFNLFSFDAFKKLRGHELGVHLKPAEHHEQHFRINDESNERDREREAEINFWGLAYYPVM